MDAGIDWDAAPPPCTGTAIAPGTDTLQGPIASAAAGTTFCLSAGVYRVTHAASLKQGQSVYGAGATQTFIYGSTVETQWTQDGGVWFTDLSLPDGGSPLDGLVFDVNADFATFVPFYWGANSDDYAFDHSRGDTFYDGQRLTRIGEAWDGGTSPAGASPWSVSAGTLFVDYDRHVIYVGSDPGKGTVEVALAPTVFEAASGATGVTLAYFSVSRFGNQIGAPGEEPIECGTGWTVHHIDGSYNHGAALRHVKQVSLSHSRFYDNGCLGTQGSLDGCVIDACDYELNNKEIRVQGGTGNGGVKVGAALDGIVRNSTVVGNYGPGVWFDVGSRFFVIEDNYIAGNFGEGIREEIGFESVMRGNTLVGNLPPAGSPGNLVIAASGAADETLEPLDAFWLDAGFGNSIEIYDNQIDDRPPVLDAGDAPAMAILISQSARFQPDGGLYVVRDVHVHDNAFTLTDGGIQVEVTSGAGLPAGIDVYDAGNTFAGDSYVTGGACVADYWYWGGAKEDFAQWQGVGLDPAPRGTCQ